MKDENAIVRRSIVVFDLDGTLIDTSEDIAFTINLVRDERHLPPLTTDEVIAAVGKGAPRLVQRLFGIEEQNVTEWMPILEAFNAVYLQHQGEHSVPYPGIEDALKTLSTHYDLYVLSNKPHAATINEVEKHGIAQYFNAVWGAGCFPGLKPDPRGVLTAIERSNSSIEQCIMVGDLSVDMNTGRNAGVKTIYVTWGFGRLNDIDPTPSVIVDSAGAMVEAVNRLLEK